MSIKLWKGNKAENIKLPVCWELMVECFGDSKGLGCTDFGESNSGAHLFSEASDGMLDANQAIKNEEIQRQRSMRETPRKPKNDIATSIAGLGECLKEGLSQSSLSEGRLKELTDAIERQSVTSSEIVNAIKQQSEATTAMLGQLVVLLSQNKGKQKLCGDILIEYTI